MFYDEARIHLASGRGGDGIVHFRREKYVPRGGPDGGNGGKGGDIVFEVDEHLNSLSPFRRNRHFTAEDGKSGGGSDKTGASGADLVIKVPAGTQIRSDPDGELLADLTQVGQQVVLLRGGRGGRGNARFATARNQAPRMAEKGEPGQEMWVRLELRLIADVGIIGLPNAGKSTLLAAVTNARPKIADYPFTTLQPNLGVAEVDHELTLVLADIPGLIEGAHSGVGLGFQFLRHVQRTRVLIHLLDGLSPDPLADYTQINAELALYDPALLEKPQLVALNKIDLPEVMDRLPEIEGQFRDHQIELYSVSALARNGLRELLYAAERELEQVGPMEIEAGELPVYKVDQDQAFDVSREPDGSWRVTGKALERAAEMTYWEYDESVRRFQRLLSKLGVEAALKEAGIETGETVHIGEYELEWLN
ncbi:MAG: GTPase ObgE [Anaerolineales bacterium]|jgi:GTP-binding protein